MVAHIRKANWQVLLTLLAISPLCQAEDGPEPGESVQALIADLESSSFVERQKATRGLIAAGPDALPPLLQSIESGPVEVAVRGLAVLESAYTSEFHGCNPRPTLSAAFRHIGQAVRHAATVSLADQAIEHLAESGRVEIAEHAAQILGRNRQLRTQLAVTQIRALGGEVANYVPQRTRGAEMELRPVAGLAIRAGGADPWVVLDDGWTGGVDGLRFVKRLRDTEFQIYLIEGLPVAEAELVELESYFDNEMVNRRGSAMLGISSAGGATGCVVHNVVTNSAADIAGIREGDLITEFDGEPVRDFYELVEKLGKKRAGDKVVLRLVREIALLTPTVTLGKWRPPKNPTINTPRVTPQPRPGSR